MTIPKTIHYCWFGGSPLPPLAVKCIASWKRYMPEYEIKEWTEDNFDVNAIPYTAEAYRQRKYAFVSDYARFWILYNEGGVYLDTDVELLRPLDDILEIGAFMAIEKDSDGNNYPMVAPGLGMAMQRGHKIIHELIKLYQTLSFLDDKGNLNQTTIVEYTTNLLKTYGLQPTAQQQTIEEINIYPSEYFCPIHNVTGRLHITENTHSIHHYAASWKRETLIDKIKNTIRPLLPETILKRYNKIINKNQL